MSIDPREPTTKDAVDTILGLAGLPIAEDEYEQLLRMYPVLRAGADALRIADARYAEPANIYSVQEHTKVGQVEAIHITSGAGQPMKGVAEAQAIAGSGLAGDRYATGQGFYSARPTDPGAREVTLLEAEVLEWLASEHGIALGPGEHRRNLTTRGVRLDGLLSQRFRIGEVLLEGVKDCPPCVHLEGLVNRPVLQPLLNRGGLRARILDGGTIRVGDRIWRLGRPQCDG